MQMAGIRRKMNYAMVSADRYPFLLLLQARSEGCHKATSAGMPTRAIKVFARVFSRLEVGFSVDQFARAKLMEITISIACALLIELIHRPLPT